MLKFLLFSKNGILRVGEVLLNKIAKEILEKLENHGYTAYIVGGYVRDFLLGKTTNDIDICTDATTKEMMKIFSGTANEYGSFNLKVNDVNIDITTFRREQNYESRRPTTITYTKDLKTDLLRRDFTINTICMDKEDHIVDILNGTKDLEEKKIRMVGDIDTKLKEDPLRILRAIRFATTLDFTLEENLQKAIIKNRYLVKNLSTYRMKEEISKILISPNYKKGLNLLKEFFLCEILEISYTNVVYTNDVCGMWAQMTINQNLPFTKNEKENIVKIREILDLKVIHAEVLYKYGLYLSLIAGEILGIEAESIYEMHKNLPIHERKDLAITFQEICETLNVSPSKEVKEIENVLIQEVLHGHILNQKEELKKYLLT